jgi:predicted RNA binding protein YcfA (HicA-like mRNA interferase family)
VKIPVLKPKEVIKVLKKLGFEEIRQKGSHKYFRHPDGRATVVPFHRKEDISKGLLRKILRDIDIDIEEFIKIQKGEEKGEAE